MARATTCLFGGRKIEIGEALKIRDSIKKRSERPEFLCTECHEPVRAHKAGGHTSAHFEHLEWNRNCENRQRRSE